MSRVKDLVGKKFHKLTVVEFSHKDKNKKSYWKCLCDCGNTKIIQGYSLSSNNTKSCGCYKIEKITKPRKKWNPIYKSNFILIPLNKGKFTKIDTKDFDKVKDYNWYAFKGKKTYYAKSTTKEIFMHRLMLKIFNKKKFVDHINCNGLDNRKSNLRLCTYSENSRNSRPCKTKKFKGTCFIKANKKRTWSASIYKGKRMHLGNFKTEKEAALAYDKAAKKYFGEFAFLNFKRRNYA